MYALILTTLHQDDFGPNVLNSTVDLLLELVAAFCLGEVVIQAQNPARPTPTPAEGS
jgi:hypothetical protein